MESKFKQTMDAVTEIPCPKCGAIPKSPCKDDSGNELPAYQLHPERILQKKIFDKSVTKKEDANEAAARIVREATED